MANAREWIAGARPRTLPIIIAPVVAGAAVAWFGAPDTKQVALRASALFAFVLCLLVGVGIQIGCNLANDYSDGVRGTDARRVGPMRLVGSGAAKPAAVKRAAWGSFAVSCVIGLVLVQWTTSMFSPATWRDPHRLVAPVVLIVVGAACVLAAWYYTGGRRPYGYAGLGEVFVFVFFGLVAVVATVYVLSPAGVPWLAAVITGVTMGCLAMAVLVANNLRDIPTDEQHGKITLPVRLGARRTRLFYAALVAVAGVGILALAATTSWLAMAGLIGIAWLGVPVRRVLAGADGPDLIPVLHITSLAELATAALVAAGLGIGWLYG